MLTEGISKPPFLSNRLGLFSESGWRRWNQQLGNEDDPKFYPGSTSGDEMLQNANLPKWPVNLEVAQQTLRRKLSIVEKRPRATCLGRFCLRNRCSRLPEAFEEGVRCRSYNCIHLLVAMELSCTDFGNLPQVREIQGKYANCTDVVYTSVLGGVDRLWLRPEPFSDGTCAVALLDRESYKVASRSVKTGSSKSLWSIQIISGSLLGSNILTQKAVKLLPHILFPNVRTSLWIDGKLGLRSNAKDVRDRVFPQVPGLGAFQHFQRKSVSEEFYVLFGLAFHDCEALSRQYEKYFGNGKFTDDDMLLEGAVLFRNHSHPMLGRFSCNWFQEVIHESKRDQLSLPWILREMNLKGIDFLRAVPFKHRKHHFKFFGHVKSRKVNSDGQPDICKHLHKTIKSPSAKITVARPG